MSKKLLLADDSITIQKVIGITFVNEDYQLTVVDNGDAALVKARESRPDLVLADVFMPGKNGYELCAAIKQDPSLAGVPVLLLAGTFEPFDEDKAMAAGADSWIAKPFESQALINRVEELLAKSVQAPEPAPEPIVEAESASAAAAPAAALRSDLWEEVDSSAVSLSDSSEAEGSAMEWDEAFGSDEELEAEAADDIWGDVSFEEDDLLEEAPPAKPVVGEEPPVFDEEPLSEAFDEDAVEEGVDFLIEEEVLLEDDVLEDEPAEDVFAGETAEDDFFFEDEPEPALEAEAEEEAPVEQSRPYGFKPIADVEDLEEEEILALNDEDILPLDEADILEEEELEPADQERTVSAETVSDVYPAAPEGALDAEESPVFEETFELVEEGPVWGPAEEEFAQEPAPEIPEPALEPAAKPAPASPLAATEEQVRTLSEEELSAIVERVAGSVIERLAGTILEKIAWEVVPDLAESLIKEEIRKIKEEADLAS